MLLLVAVVALPFAMMQKQETIRPDIWMMPYFQGVFWSGIVTGILFWSVPPLTIALFVRSPKQAAAVGFGLCLIWMLPYFYPMKFAYDSFVSGICDGIRCGPFDCLYPLRLLLCDDHSGKPISIPIETLIYSLWLIVYAATCFLIAKSCRLQGQPTKGER